MTKQDFPEPLVARNARRCSWWESEFRLAMARAELAFVNELVRGITEEGWDRSRSGATSSPMRKPE